MENQSSTEPVLFQPENLPPDNSIRLDDVWGLFPTMTSVPTGVPFRVGQQIVVGNSNTLYIYDATNHTWRTIQAPTAEWTKYTSTTFSASSIATTYSSLPSHDMWKLRFRITGGDGTSIIGIRFNNDSGANYLSRDSAGAGANLSYIRFLNATLTGAATGIIGEMLITGKRDAARSALTCVGTNIDDTLHTTSVTATGVFTNATTDLTQLDLVSIAAADSWTGVMEIWYRDLA